MKHRTDVVMVDIIHKIKDTFPFSLSEEELCGDSCTHGCPLKLLDYLYMEITDWEERLENGEIPNFKDIQKITKTSKKIYRALEKNNLVGSKSEKMESDPL